MQADLEQNVTSSLLVEAQRDVAFSRVEQNESSTNRRRGGR